MSCGKALLRLLPTMGAATLVDFILMFLGLVVEIPAGHPSGAANGCAQARIARHGPNGRPPGGTQGTSRQSALLGGRHSGTTAERETDNENRCQ